LKIEDKNENYLGQPSCNDAKMAVSAIRTHADINQKRILKSINSLTR